MAFEKLFEPVRINTGDIMHLARAIKQVVNIPVMAVGGRMTPEVAEKAIRENSIDIAMIGRL